MAMATVCGAGEFLIPAERGVSAADYLEIVRAMASGVRAADPSAAIGAGGPCATDDFAKAFIGFGESEEIDFWQIADPTPERVKMLRGLFDSAGGRAVRLVDAKGASLDPVAKTAPSRIDGTLPSPLLVAGTGRAYVLEPNGKISWLRTGCGNIHRVQRCGDSVYYSNGDLFRCRLPDTKAELVYRPKSRVGAGVLGFKSGDASIQTALSRYENVKVVLIAPEELELPAYMKYEVCDRYGIDYKEVDNMESVMGELDVLYMTRVQRERFFNEDDCLRMKDFYVLDANKMELAPEDMYVLHPLPRVNEISTDIDNDPRAAYFRQAQYGVYIRMALILKLLEIEVK